MRYLFEERGHHRLTIDPALANEGAIRCYEAVGFRRVGSSQYERTDDGTWRDGLLLDLLAGDRRSAVASRREVRNGSRDHVGVFVTFHYDDGVDAEAVTRIAQGSRGTLPRPARSAQQGLHCRRGSGRGHELLCLG